MPATDSQPLDRVFSALSDPTRRAILARLAAGPATVGKLAEPFSISGPAVTKHMKVLERAGLVRRSVRGREHHCSLDPRALEGAREWLEFHRRFWSERLRELETLLTEEPETEKKNPSNHRQKGDTP